MFRVIDTNQDNCYTILDTEDGVRETLWESEIEDIIEDSGIKIQGMTDDFVIPFETAKEIINNFDKECFSNRVIYCPLINSINRRGFYNELFNYFVETGFGETPLKKVISSEIKNKDNTSNIRIKTSGMMTQIPSDDSCDFFEKSYLDYIKSSDIVICVPAVLNFNRLYNYLRQFNKDFIIVCPEYLSPNLKIDLIKENVFISPLNKESKLRIKGERGTYYYVSACLISSFEPKNYYTQACLYNIEEREYFDNMDILYCKSFSEIPSEYHGLIGVSSQFYKWFNREQFKIVEFYPFLTYKDTRIRNIVVLDKF